MANHLLHLPVAVLGSAPAPDGEQAEEATANASFAIEDLIPAGIILAIAIVVGLALRYGAERALRERNDILARLFGRTLFLIALSVGLVYSLSNLGIRVGLLLGALGVGGFAIAFALKDTLENFISGVILQLRQPFDYDDTVKIGDYAGNVTDIDLRAVSMTLFSGEKVIIPSSEVLQNPIENWTANPNRRIDIEVGVAYDSDIGDVCQLLTFALGDVEGVLDDPPPDCVFDGFGASAIALKARVWYPSDGPFFDVQRGAAIAVKRALDETGVEIPFPITTVLSAGGNDSGDGTSEGQTEASGDRGGAGRSGTGPDGDEIEREGRDADAAEGE